MSNVQKEIKELRKAAQRQGWRVEKTSGRSAHWKFYAPDGVNIVTVQSTPSGPRWKQNAVAELRKYGFEWKGR